MRACVRVPAMWPAWRVLPVLLAMRSGRAVPAVRVGLVWLATVSGTCCGKRSRSGRAAAQRAERGGSQSRCVASLC